MARALALCLALLCSAPAQPDGKSALNRLYARRQWTELYRAVQARRDAPFYRGVVAAVFGDDRHAEPLLQSVIRSSPASHEAYESYEWLTHIYFRHGEYRRLIANMEARWTAFPDAAELKKEQAALAGFRNLPDQITGNRHPSTLRHDPRSIFIPLTINGSSAAYFFDTGAWLNCMSESEAKRLNLEIHDASGTVGTATGERIGFRTAIARELTVGRIHFRNVSFLVFRDNEEPWSSLPAGRRGLVGIPVILGFGSLRWRQDGTIEIATRRGRLDPSKSNLFFDDDHLIVKAGLRDQEVLATLDTGAETTDLYSPFAEKFPSLARSGAKGSMDIRGVGNASAVDAISIPDVPFTLGNYTVALRPARLLLKDIGAKNCVGNFGIDLLMQAQAFRIDFSSMRLDLEP